MNLKVKFAVKIMMFFVLIAQQNAIFLNLKINQSAFNQYANLFVLGDSLSDTGAFITYQGGFSYETVRVPGCKQELLSSKPWNLNARCRQVIKSWQPKNFTAPFYRNSFSNGPVTVEVVADKLGITNFKSGSYSAGEFDNFGYNYATGTAKILGSSDLSNYEFTAHLQSVVLESDRYNLAQQAVQLKRHHPIITDKDLLIINIGSNDLIEIIRAWLFLDMRSLKELLLERLTRVVETLFTQVRDMIDYGFKRVVVVNMADFNRTPRFLLDRETNEVAHEIVKKYNQRFHYQFETLTQNIEFKKKLRMFDANVAFHNILEQYDSEHKIIRKPAVEINWRSAFFFKNTFDAYFINDADESNVDNYAFFDDIHPSKVFHYDLAIKLLQVIEVPWFY